LKDFRKVVENAGAAIVNMTVSGKDSAYAADRDERVEGDCELQKMGRRAAALGSPAFVRMCSVKDVNPNVSGSAKA